MKSGAAKISPRALQTNAPKLPSIGPPMPTHASIQALRGASLSAMNAPMNGMKTGAPTLSPNFLATSKWPTPELGVNPDHQQHGAARLQQDRQELQER